MRQYLRYTILFSVISLAVHAAPNDTFFANTATPPAAPKKTNGGFAVPTVLSPEEFAKRVDSINKQTDAQISKEVASTVPKPIAPTGTTTTQPTTVASPTVTTQPQQPQQPVYSGFGGAPAASAPTSQPTQPKTAPQSGGWQIQY